MNTKLRYIKSVKLNKCVRFNNYKILLRGYRTIMERNIPCYWIRGLKLAKIQMIQHTESESQIQHNQSKLMEIDIMKI